MAPTRVNGEEIVKLLLPITKQNGSSEAFARKDEDVDIFEYLYDQFDAANSYQRANDEEGQAHHSESCKAVKL